MDLRQHIFIILCLAGLSILQAQPISFLPPAAVAGGGLEFPIPANSLAVADFNGDGKADLVVIGNSRYSRISSTRRPLCKSLLAL